MASKKENSGSAGEAKETKGEREEISNPVIVGHYDAEGYYSSDGHLRENDQSPVTEPTTYYNEERAARLTRSGYRYDHINDALQLPDGAPVNTDGELQLMRNSGPSNECAIQGGRRKKKSRRKKKGGMYKTVSLHEWNHVQLVKNNYKRWFDECKEREKELKAALASASTGKQLPAELEKNIASFLGGGRRKKRSRRKKKGGLGATGAISASLKKNKKPKIISRADQMRLKQLPIYKPSIDSEEIKMAPTNPLFLKKMKDAALKREKKAMLKSKKSRNLLVGGRKKRKSRKKKKSRTRRTRRRKRRRTRRRRRR